MALQVTPSQTIGPFFSIGLTWDDGAFVVPEGTDGAFWIRGRVTDGEGEPVPDAVVETWQADPDGRYRHPDDPQADGGGFRGFARGLLNRVVTRVYFADEADLNAADPVLAGLPADRRATLLAEPADDGYRFDVRLQGEDETVFFAV